MDHAPCSESSSGGALLHNIRVRYFEDKIYTGPAKPCKSPELQCLFPMQFSLTARTCVVPQIHCRPLEFGIVQIFVDLSVHRSGCVWATALAAARCMSLAQAEASGRRSCCRSTRTVRFRVCTQRRWSGGARVRLLPAVQRGQATEARAQGHATIRSTSRKGSARPLKFVESGRARTEHIVGQRRCEVRKLGFLTFSPSRTPRQVKLLRLRFSSASSLFCSRIVPSDAKDLYRREFVPRMTSGPHRSYRRRNLSSSLPRRSTGELSSFVRARRLKRVTSSKRRPASRVC